MKRGGIGRCEGIKASGWWLVAGGWGAPDSAGSRIEDRDRRSGGAPDGAAAGGWCDSVCQKMKRALQD